MVELSFSRVRGNGRVSRLPRPCAMCLEPDCTQDMLKSTNIISLRLTATLDSTNNKCESRSRRMMNYAFVLIRQDLFTAALPRSHRVVSTPKCKLALEQQLQLRLLRGIGAKRDHLSDFNSKILCYHRRSDGSFSAWLNYTIDETHVTTKSTFQSQVHFKMLSFVSIRPSVSPRTPCIP